MSCSEEKDKPPVPSVWRSPSPGLTHHHPSPALASSVWSAQGSGSIPDSPPACPQAAGCPHPGLQGPIWSPSWFPPGSEHPIPVTSFLTQEPWVLPKSSGFPWVRGCAFAFVYSSSKTLTVIADLPCPLQALGWAQNPGPARGSQPDGGRKLRSEGAGQNEGR